MRWSAIASRINDDDIELVIAPLRERWAREPRIAKSKELDICP